VAAGLGPPAEHASVSLLILPRFRIPLTGLQAVHHRLAEGPRASEIPAAARRTILVFVV
jgi:hypothetical protein